MLRLIAALGLGLALGCTNGATPSRELGVGGDGAPVSDLAIRADGSAPDLAAPDLAAADLAVPDLAVPDLAVPDLAGAIDSAVDSLTGPTIIDQIPGVVVSTLAGSDTAGAQNGQGAAAQFSNPTSVARDGAGNLLVVEYDGARVRKLDPAGNTTTLTSQADFTSPFAIAISSTGVIIAQTDDDKTGMRSDTSGTLWQIDPMTGVATTTLEMQNRPRGLGALGAGMIAVADRGSFTVSIFNPTTQVLTPLAGAPGVSGYVDDVGANAQFGDPVGVVALADQSLIVADVANHVLRRVAPDGTVSTFAGDGVAGMIDGPKGTCRFDQPRALAIDTAGNLYVSDNGNHRIRRIGVDNVVRSLAGTGSAGFSDGPGPTAAFYGQEGIAAAPNGKTVYVADGNGGDGNGFHRIRQITIP